MYKNIQICISQYASWYGYSGEKYALENKSKYKYRY